MSHRAGLLLPAVAALVLAGCSSVSPSAARTSSGWGITVYYTVVERYHQGAPTKVTGCLRLDCTNGHDDLGTYPADFVRDVQTEGTGVTTGGKYLNWSYDTGYWLDTAPRDTDGNPLRPYASAAADPGVLRHGTRFQFTDCGRQDDGSAVPAAVCGAFQRPVWRIDDEFTPGLGGPRHIDLYIGPETGPGFTSSDSYVTLKDATLRLT
jgi:hypothetical protein